MYTKNNKIKSVLKIFLNDLGEYLKENNKRAITGFGRNKEIWFYNTSNFPIKDCFKLNRDLGIHNINYFNKKNWTRIKH